MWRWQSYQHMFVQSNAPSTAHMPAFHCQLLTVLPLYCSCTASPLVGKHWCWIFWQFDVQTVEFARASEVLVRAWDSSMNTQPSHLTWNLMGMMNNCHFRIKLHQHVDAQVRGAWCVHWAVWRGVIRWECGVRHFGLHQHGARCMGPTCMNLVQDFQH
jgi:hypothetical protein